SSSSRVSNGHGLVSDTRSWLFRASSPLVEPGRQEALDLTAAPGSLEASRDSLVLDDDEGRHRLDLESFDQVGMLLLRDLHDLERAVVAPPLQHLGEKTFHPPAVTRQRR